MASIIRFEIEGFKAFREPFTLDLPQAENFVIYGENGSGKSSLYYALHAVLQSVFKDDRGAKYFTPGDIENLVNIYRMDEARRYVFEPHITISFDDGEIWRLDRNGLDTHNNDDKVKKTNNNAIFINHSYITRFRAARNSQEIDLWPVFYKDILPFYLPAGKQEFITDIYDNIVEKSKKSPMPRLSNQRYLRLISMFNSDLEDLINKINSNASRIYNAYFKDAGNNLGIQVRYYSDTDARNIHNEPLYLFYGNNRFGQRIEKRLYAPFIGLTIKDNGQDINKPQTYFNEAKLTAIALSIRFACLSQHPIDGAFMALDDMLISLDMSNRTKVVDYLLNEVIGKYKIYLFTHDKYFFEYFKHRSKKSSVSWVYKEICMIDNTPYERDSRTYLGNAEYYIRKHEYEIAGNFLRKEAEAFCKMFLPKKWQYTEDYVILDLNGLIQNSIRYATESEIADISLFERLDDYRKFVLNPSSHDSYEVVKFREDVEKCLVTLIELNKINNRPIFTKGQRLKFTLKEAIAPHDIYEFEIKIVGDFRLISQNGHDAVITKGDVHYTVSKNGAKGKEQFTCTTLKKFYEKNYNKSDQTTPADYLDAIIDVATGNPIRMLI